MNRVEIRGGLTRDPSMKVVGDGLHLLEFTVAVNGTRYDRETRGTVVKTTYVSVQAWGTVADEIVAAYQLTKGDEVYVLGELDQHEIEKSDGTKDRKTRVTAFRVDVIRCKYRNGQRPTSPEPEQSIEPPF